MTARDLMQSDVTAVREDASVGQLCDIFQAQHVNGVPVVGDDGSLVGIVSEEDVLFGAMGIPQGEAPAVAGRVGDIMTSPAICATEETDIVELCRMMWGMRIHHIPIVSGTKVIGIVSSLDLVRAVAEGALRP
jgi:CBS domain-containing protein